MFARAVNVCHISAVRLLHGSCPSDLRLQTMPAASRGQGLRGPLSRYRREMAASKSTKRRVPGSQARRFMAVYKLF